MIYCCVLLNVQKSIVWAEIALSYTFWISSVIEEASSFCNFQKLKLQKLSIHGKNLVMEKQAHFV